MVLHFLLMVFVVSKPQQKVIDQQKNKIGRRDCILGEFLKPTYPPSIIHFLQLYQMSLQNCAQNDPFIIIYNHRKAPKLQTEKKTAKRRHHDYSTLPHSIIVTRRMAAQLQYKKQQVQILMESQMLGLNNSKSGQLGIREDVNFFDQEDLDRCIPMDEVPQEQITYNLIDPTLSSNYSKLERTLCGIGVTAFQEDMQEGMRPTFDVQFSSPFQQMMDITF